MSGSKNKSKTPDLKYQAKKGSTATALPNTEDEEFERRKQDWQSELEEMSEFLVIRSTQEQQEEGADHPIDSAFIEDRDGMPYLKAVFDVRHFRKEDISVTVEGAQLVMTAQNLEDRDDRTYTRTIVRKVDLPKHVDHKMMHCDVNDGLLSIEMPFHLPPSKKPLGPNIFPIITDADGHKKIRVIVFIGPDFTSDDVTVETNGKHLSIQASYDAELGKYGRQVQQREFKREYMLPDHLDADRVDHVLGPDGRLFIDIHLKDEKPYRCTISAEELQ